MATQGEAGHGKNEPTVGIEAAGVKEQLGDYDAVISEARAGTESEVTMSFKEGIRLYPKAIAWSMLLSTAIIMEGFDVVLMGSFYAQTQFRERYGTRGSDGRFLISAAWQAGLSNAPQVGSILGLLLNGIVCERYGYRKTLIGALIALTGFIAIQFFAQNIETLFAGAFLLGIPWGIFQTLTVAYASEIMPTALRAYLTTYVNLCWVIGQVIASGVLKGVLPWQSQWAYRLPFALQWMWPVPIAVGTFFAPESPWWLVRRGRDEDARRALQRLTSPQDTSFNADNIIGMIKHTNAMEKSMSSGTSYKHCFMGTDRRRTEIACGVWMIQNLCGSAFMGYSTFFYLQAGLSESDSFSMSLAQYSIGIIGTIMSWFCMRTFGRRFLYLAGLGIMFAVLLVIGGVGTVPQPNPAASWAIGSMLLVYTFFYDFTVGPVCYCLVAEISSTRLRAKTIVIARSCYNIIGIINAVITPYMLGEDAWNWGAKTGFFWAGICSVCFLWTYFRLPEPKGRTYGELDVLFEKKISARNFASTVVDQYSSHAAPAGSHASTTPHNEKEKDESSVSYEEEVRRS